MRPNTRVEFADYILRRLGHPVIKINISSEQIQDRIDDALQVFSEHHEDGLERIILKHVITQAEVDIAVSLGWLDMTVPDSVFAIVNVFPLENGFTNNFFDVRYQMMLSSLPSIGSFDLVGYSMKRDHLALLDEMLNQKTNFEYYRAKGILRVYLDRDYLQPGQNILFEVQSVLDPDAFGRIYNSDQLKKYTTALVKRQWGSNLSKYNNVQMPGGITFNGEQIYQQADEEIQKIEESLRDRHPPGGFMA